MTPPLSFPEALVWWSGARTRCTFWQNSKSVLVIRVPGEQYQCTTSRKVEGNLTGFCSEFSWWIWVERETFDRRRWETEIGFWRGEWAIRKQLFWSSIRRYSLSKYWMEARWCRETMALLSGRRDAFRWWRKFSWLKVAWFELGLFAHL